MPFWIDYPALQTRKWQDQNGQDRYTTEVVVQGYAGIMQMLGGRNNQGMGNTGNNYQNNNSGQWGQPQQSSTHQNQYQQPAQQQSYQQPPAQNNQATQQHADMPDFDDDIPF